MTDPNATAFPVLDIYQTKIAGSSEGLTKREAFAMAALQGLLACSMPTTHCLPTLAVRYADKLIAKLNEEPQS